MQPAEGHSSRNGCSSQDLPCNLWMALAHPLLCSKLLVKGGNAVTASR